MLKNDDSDDQNDNPIEGYSGESVPLYDTLLIRLTELYIIDLNNNFI